MQLWFTRISHQSRIFILSSSVPQGEKDNHNRDGKKYEHKIKTQYCSTYTVRAGDYTNKSSVMLVETSWIRIKIVSFLGSSERGENDGGFSIYSQE